MPPTNALVTPLLTDLYQITMAYAYWKNNRQDDPAVFELFFRKNPFGGEYTIFAGLDQVLKHLESFHFTESDIHYLKTVPSLQHCDPQFFDWMATLTTQHVKVRAIQEGTVVFPRVPLLILECPLAMGQLLETTLLTLVNYPSLLTTNAARMVRAANTIQKGGTSRDGYESSDSNHHPSSCSLYPVQCSVQPQCIEFGLRRAQGPDGGFSASKYSSMGGFTATSNVLAGKLCSLPVAGTHAHAFVQSYSALQQVVDNSVDCKITGERVKVLPKVLEYRTTLGATDSNYVTSNDGELAAFIAYATSFPDSFLALIDTYDTLQSGLRNFVLVSMVLDDLGYQPRGIRLDSGDLAYLSMEVAQFFQGLSDKRPVFATCSIVASNDINESVLDALNKQDHAITAYGIGTNLVTCQAQPALGCVYKLVQIDDKPRMKLSQEINKVLIPGKKKAYRLFGKDGRPILDVMLADHEAVPVAGKRLMCRHPFVERKRAIVTPTKVEELHVTVFEHGRVVEGTNRSMDEARVSVQSQLQSLRPDILRYKNPTPYKVSVSDYIYEFLHKLWQEETPITELS